LIFDDAKCIDSTLIPPKIFSTLPYKNIVQYRQFGIYAVELKKFLKFGTKFDLIIPLKWGY